MQNLTKTELHCHTKMSAGCGLIGPSELVHFAYDNGYKNIAITDCGNVQAFPEVYQTWKKLWKGYAEDCAKKNINADREHFLKVIYGMEGTLLGEDGETYPVLIYAKNQDGIRNLYKIVTESNLHYSDKTPRIPRSLLEEHRRGLVIGAVCDEGEILQAIEAGRNDTEVRERIAFYDFLEVVPCGSWNEHLNKLVLLGKECGKLLVAASDA
ncbi:MAG: PHP domain-containing protein [Lachnospiraceae bacterium]|nr:PHP domain-containing protein [Lachnospiraceae bacterium]